MVDIAWGPPCPDTRHVVYGGCDNLDGRARPSRCRGRLARLDAELLVIVEQDLYSCAPEVRLPIPVRTREHLARCGLSGTRRPNTNQ
ncbi:hypothetical protein [Streptomyces sp. NPDC001843]|uniref:hypothetical protein n=1 Tax=Streptomyces sp. NPDC001843 TaxID=3364617 RepID=UPI0036A32909